MQPLSNIDVFDGGRMKCLEVDIMCELRPISSGFGLIYYSNVEGFWVNIEYLTRHLQDFSFSVENPRPILPDSEVRDRLVTLCSNTYAV